MGRLLSACCLLLASWGCGGSINQYLLIAQRGDAEQVREAVVEIGREIQKRESEGYDLTEGELQAVEYLKDVARAHKDFITRMAALSSLARLKNPDAGDVFMAGLEADHFGVRWEAAKALTLHPVEDASPFLAERLHRETKPEVRIDLIKALARVGDRAALKILLEVFLDPLGKYRNNKLKAYDGVRAISGRTYGFEDQIAWSRYYDEEFPESDAPPEEPKEDGPAAGDAPPTDSGRGRP